jgi:hypothetical protein
LKKIIRLGFPEGFPVGENIKHAVYYSVKERKQTEKVAGFVERPIVLVHQAPHNGRYNHASVVHGTVQPRREVADVLISLLVFSLLDLILLAVGLNDFGKDGDEEEPLGCAEKARAK